MDHTPTSSFDKHGNVIPRSPVQVWIARVVIGVLVMMIIALQFSGAPRIEKFSDGDLTVYTSQSSLVDCFFMVTPFITGVLAFVYVLQRGIFHFFAVALFAVTAWSGFIAFQMDTSNHRVTVGPDRVTREVGTVANPIVHEIDLANTASLSINEVPGSRGPKFELVATSAIDGTQTRLPIFELMRAALPQIVENAIKKMWSSESWLTVRAFRPHFE